MDWLEEVTYGTNSEEALFEDDLTLDDFDTAEFDSNAEIELLDPWENQFQLLEIHSYPVNCKPNLKLVLFYLIKLHLNVYTLGLFCSVQFRTH